MHKHIFSILIFLLAVTQTGIQGQNRTYSPVSRFGIGEINRNGNGPSTGMGQTGIALNSPTGLNVLNPASYAWMDSLSFLFETGLQGFTQTISDNLASSDFSNITFDYFSIGFPVTKRIAASAGITTFSRTGYKIEQNNSNSTWFGMGGGNISKAYLSLAVKPAKYFSAGANFSYLFGNVKNISNSSFTDNIGSLDYGRMSEMHVNDLYLDFGVQGKIPLAQNKSITVGAVYTPEQSINNQYTTFTAQGSYVVNSTLVMGGDTVEYVPLQDKNFKLPTSYGIGISYQTDGLLTVAVDYKVEKWGSTRFPDPYTKTQDARRFSAGIEYTPNDRSATQYIKRIKYRAGGFSQNDYLLIENNESNEYGMTFGLGFPLKRSKSAINLACEIGEKNYQTSSNFKETYIRFLLNFSLHEYWFVKQKFD